MSRFLVQLFHLHRRLSLLTISSKLVVSVDRTGLTSAVASAKCGVPPQRLISSRIQPSDLWEGSSYEILLRKFEFSLQDDSLDEAWEAFSNFKRLHGYPEHQLVSKLIASLSYSTNSDWIRKAYDLAVVISKERPDLVRPESFSTLSLSLARHQMPIPASTVLRIMLERGKFAPKDILTTFFLHLVKSQIGSYLAMDLLIEICEYFLNCGLYSRNAVKINRIKHSILIFNLVLNSCVRFTCLIKAGQIIEMMARVGAIADANSILIISQIHEMMGERVNLQNLKVHIDRITSASMNNQYCHFYDCLLSLHFMYNDLDAAVELMLDLFQRRKSQHSSTRGSLAETNASQRKCYFHIGSSNLGMGNRITVAPKNLENDFLVAAQRHLGFIHFMDGKLVPSYKFLAKLTNVCVKERMVDKLSNFLINMHKDIDPGGANLCSDVLHACIMLDWLDAAHDILDDLELAKVSIEASSYLALLNAYSKKNMYKESKILLKQMKKSGLVVSISDEYKCALGYASFPISDIKASNSLEKSELVQFLELENKKYSLESHLIYEFNSSILFFCKAKMMEDALKTLKRMREKNVQPTVLTFNYLVNGYSSLEMYREITILWEDIRRQMECGALSANRDLFDCLLWNFLKGGYFARSMEIIDYMLKNNVYVDKWKYRMEFLNNHKNLYRSLKESSCRTDAQSRRLQHVKAFRKWAGIDQ
ncbi:pentatricopeptide repeat-containing protein At4g17616 isoform X1 [Curcuma longa]|uniref:pentatricopeptide repeat-containing protein At4g17616 isoform X1 n=1 Tax=Curcuma longa TaxID=136217 RepID=UPI003D9EF1E9